ncbi:hypothetical protein BKI51_06975 [Alphaproteobacteria bacterium AO1-B]|nr:hypothetical protein BKI51_06975 [Alphaproteobacteria bacterium AO1-B]
MLLSARQDRSAWLNIQQVFTSVCINQKASTVRTNEARIIFEYVLFAGEAAFDFEMKSGFWCFRTRYTEMKGTLGNLKRSMIRRFSMLIHDRLAPAE